MSKISTVGEQPNDLKKAIDAAPFFPANRKNDLKNSLGAAEWFPGSVRTVPCVFFSRGYCREGAACPYPHDAAVQATGTASVTQSNNFIVDPPVAFPARICRFYAMGSCNRGQDCPFSHDNAVENMLDPKAPAWIDGKIGDGGAAVETMELCRFFAKGHCKSGSMCRFSHDNAAVTMLPGRQTHTDVDGELTTDVIGFTGRCRFGAGNYRAPHNTHFSPSLYLSLSPTSS